ncbi:fibrillin-2-like [Octopus sinensis]|uniref:Fibrillin-2-like n=1 Tax=Octopus sinensis TaxID=2607531 RepID=A0A7E6F255_9MOLL|nr:fibrillin-2-like [Octopus sinensis]
MKNLVLFSFVFVVGLLVIEGKQTTERPSVNNEEVTVIAKPFENVTASDGEDKAVTDSPSTTEGGKAALRTDCSTHLKIGKRNVRGWCITNPCGRYGLCIEIPGTYHCICQPGFRFNEKTCVDINECKKNNGGCPFPYRCVNRPGFHYCACPFGFVARRNMCYLSIPQRNLNIAIPGNPTAIPKYQIL